MTIIVRDVFQAKYGKGGELVQHFETLTPLAAKAGVPMEGKILTDASGEFFTVVTEREYKSLADWESSFRKTMGVPEFGKWFAKMVPLVENGRREFYNVEADVSAAKNSPKPAARRR
jgi:hypothetical protein